MHDKSINRNYSDLNYNSDLFLDYLEQVLQLESVASKIG